MLIAAIIVLAFFTLVYIGILIFHYFDLKKNDYECIARLSKRLAILAHVCHVVICIGGSTGAVFLIAFVENDTYGGLIGCLIFFGILTILLVIIAVFPFVAIKGNEIYKRTFIRIKSFKIEDVKNIDCCIGDYVIVLKNDIRISVSAGSKEAENLIKLIWDKKAGKIYLSNPNIVEQKEPLNDVQNPEEKEERITLTQIGKEFRDNFPTFKRKQLIANLVSTSVIMLILAGGCLTFFLTNKKPKWLIMLIGCAVILLFFVVMIFRANSNLDKEMQNSDEWLGNKHKFDDGRVKGSAKKKFKSSLPVLIAFAVGCSVIGVICGVEGNLKPVSQSQLVAVSGEFEYIRNSGDSLQDELAIGLKGDVTEYRISSTDYSFFDLSFKKEVSVGDMVTIYIDSTRKPNSVNYEGRTQWIYAYAVSANAKDYFTYDNYLVAFNKNQLATKIAFIVCVSTAGSCLLGIGASFAVYKSRSKKETLEV